MKVKTHQSDKQEYQIRVDGVPKYWPYMIDKEAIDKWLKLCADNPDCYVDIVQVSTSIIVNQGTYHQMERYFN